MSTAISRFYRPVRFLLDDRDPDVQQYPDLTLANGVRTVIELNRVPDFALTEDEASITPALTDPNQFALVALHTAKAFVDPDPSNYSYRRRAASESFGHRYEFLATLAQEIHNLENGTMFSGWQACSQWFSRGAGCRSCCPPASALVVPETVLWINELVLVVGEHLIGSYTFDRTLRLGTVRVTGTAGVTETVLGLEVAGSLTGHQITLPAGDSIPFEVTAAPGALLPGGLPVRWKVISGPAPQDAPYGIALTGTVAPP